MFIFNLLSDCEFTNCTSSASALGLAFLFFASSRRCNFSLRFFMCLTLDTRGSFSCTFIAKDFQIVGSWADIYCPLNAFFLNIDSFKFVFLKIYDESPARIFLDRHLSFEWDTSNTLNERHDTTSDHVFGREERRLSTALNLDSNFILFWLLRTKLAGLMKVEKFKSSSSNWNNNNKRICHTKQKKNNQLSVASKNTKKHSLMRVSFYSCFSCEISDGI